MDPDANLEEQLFLAKKIQNEQAVNENDLNRLTELVVALNEWIQKGGALPKKWFTAQW
jgi:hypothetical protein